MITFTTVDDYANCVYIQYRPMGIRETVETVRVTDSINFDWDAEGNLVGIEFLSIQAWKKAASKAAIEAATVRKTP